MAIAESPQQDCDFERIREIAGIDAIVRHYEETLSRELEVIDLRRETVVFRDGIIVERRPLPGDPAGYRVVDLGDAELLLRVGTRSGALPRRRLRPERHHRASPGRAKRLPAVRDGALGGSRREPAEAEDPQEDGRHARAQEPGRHQRRQELAAAPLARLARRGRRRVPRREYPGPPAEPRHRVGAAPAPARRRARLLPAGTPARERGAWRRLHAQRQLVREPHHLAHVLRPEPLPLLQRRPAASTSTPRRRCGRSSR